MRAFALAFVLAVAAPAAGCGTEDESEGDGGGSEQPATQLEITVTGGGSDERWSLTCEPAGGDHPDPDAACAALADHAEALEAVDGMAACTQIYGGPQQATVDGSVDGSPYEGRFSRENGCEIARWEALQPLLVVRGGA